MVATEVLLTATDATAGVRLGAREIGSGLQHHLQRSAARAAQPEAGCEPWVTRTSTDDRTVSEIAAEVIEVCGWAAVAGQSWS